MSIECTTKCFPLQPATTVDKNQNDFNDCIASPSILPISFRPHPKSYNILQFFLKNVLIADIHFELGSASWVISKITNINNGVSLESGTHNVIAYGFWNFTLNDNIAGLSSESSDIKSRDYIKGDIYAIDATCFQPKIYIRFIRHINPEIIYNNLIVNANQCKNIRVPSIIIKAQTNIDGSDLGDANFQIHDKIKYYDYNSDIINDCKVRYINNKNIQQTTFRQNNLSIYNILKGEGLTACEKISGLFVENEVKLGIDFVSFYENIITYVVVRYILSKLLYSDFNINYLLQSYYEQFIKDLEKSRFCAFVEYFLNCNNPTYQYDKFFL